MIIPPKESNVKILNLLQDLKNQKFDLESSILKLADDMYSEKYTINIEDNELKPDDLGLRQDQLLYMIKYNTALSNRILCIERQLKHD